MSLLVIAAVVGAVLTFANEVLKQNHFGKVVNTVLADAVQLIGATLVALQATGSSSITWNDIGTAVLAGFAAFAATYIGVVKPILGNKLQDATSIKPAAPAPPPTAL